MGAETRILPSDLHSIPNFQIPKISLQNEFDILQEIGEGWFAKVFLVEHRKTRSEIILKAIHKESTTPEKLIQEFHYSYLLGILNGSNVIVKTLDVLFECQGFYWFAQEYAPFGDLCSNISDIGIGEIYAKRVAKQIGSALDFLHGHDLVHRDVKVDNVLVFNLDFSKVKLSDFGACRRKGAFVTRFNEWVPYCPPEIVAKSQDTSYSVQFYHDTWQFGVLLFLCLTGCVPWQKADKFDPGYQSFDIWLRSRVMKTPKAFKILSNKARRLFRKLFDPNPNKRVSTSLTDEIQKYIFDKWLTKIPENKPTDDMSTNMSNLSFHSSQTDKNHLLSTLTRFGVETTVDRNLKKDRIKEWIATSTIEEEDAEEEEEGSFDDSEKGFSVLTAAATEK